MPLLSTYLGHIDPNSTFWYLHATQPLRAPSPASSKESRAAGHDRARPDPASVLHRATDHPAQGQPAHGGIPRLVAPAAVLRAAADRQTKPPRPRRRRRAADRRVPGPPRARARDSATTRNARLAAIHSLFRYAALRHPEHAASIARVLEIPATRHRKTTVACILDRNEIERRAARGAGSSHLGRAPRPRDAARRDPDRRARLRTHQPDDRPGEPHHRRAPACDRQGRQGALRDPHQRDRRGPPRVAARTPRATAPAAVPDPSRRAADHTRVRAVARQAHRHSHLRMPDTQHQTDDSAHAAAHTNAMLLRAENVDIYTIALWLGHATVETTETTSTPTPSSSTRRSNEPHRSAPDPAATGRPTRSSRSSKGPRTHPGVLVLPIFELGPRASEDDPLAGDAPRADLARVEGLDVRRDQRGRA